MAYLTLLASLMVFASQVPVVHLRGIHNTSLLTRQTGPIDPASLPPACSQACIPLVTIVNSCTSASPVDCGCSVATEQAFTNCFNCAISLSSAIAPQAQQVLDEFIQGCNAAGVSLPSTTVSGGVAGATFTASGDPPIPTLPNGNGTGGAIPTESGGSAGTPSTGGSSGGQLIPSGPIVTFTQAGPSSVALPTATGSGGPAVGGVGQGRSAAIRARTTRGPLGIGLAAALAYTVLF